MIPTIICSSLISFFTKENITFVLAVIGSVGTIISWFFYWATTRRHVEVEIFDYSSHWGRIAQLFIHFQNQSRSPICIVSVSLLFNGKEVCCELVPKKIRLEGDELLKTPMFPLNLLGKQGSLCFLEFVGFEHIELVPGSNLVLLINTNRGQIRKSVTLSNTSRYLHIM